MKLTTKTRYGLRAMLELAFNENLGTLSIKALAEKQQIPEAYLEQLMITLRKNGLVKATRGAQGGYVLGDDAGNITVGQIMRVLEGTLAPVSCLVDDNFCERIDQCAMHLLWQRLQSGINAIVDGITLRDMVDDQRMLNSHNLKGDMNNA